MPHLFTVYSCNDTRIGGGLATAVRVITARPARLPAEPYMGMQRYFVTACTNYRERHFVSPAAVHPIREHLLQQALAFGFDVTAYCFMPDHLHVLLAARHDDAEFRECMRRFKQMSAYHHRKSRRSALWQPGYFERVLRNDEATGAVVRYILENPVRAGLTQRFQDYPFSGSTVYSTAQLADLWQEFELRRNGRT